MPVRTRSSDDSDGERLLHCARLCIAAIMSTTADSFATLVLEGPDAATFLQGYVTADLDDLRPEAALPMAYCNLKGRVLASGWALGEPTCVRLLIHASVAEDCAASLAKYLLFAKSKLRRDDAGVSFSQQQRSPDAVELPPTGWFATFGAGASGHIGFADACVHTGFVVVAKAVSEAFLPQMIGLTHMGAVSFAKGCYLGQEVVARAEHLGQVKQTLCRYDCEAGLPAIGADVLVDGRKVGTVVASGEKAVLAAVRGEPGAAIADGCALRQAELSAA